MELPKRIRIPGDSTAKFIFEYRWACMIPNMFTVNQYERELFGTRTMGNDEDDIKQANRLVRVNKTIAELAVIFMSSNKIVFINPEESVEIYETIYEHIDKWLKIEATRINGRHAPLEDLKLLDALAESIFLPASIVYASVTVQRPVFSFMKSTGNMRHPNSNLVGRNSKPKLIEIDSKNLNRGGEWR